MHVREKTQKNLPSFEAWEGVTGVTCYEFADSVLVGVHDDASLFHLLLSAMRAFAVHRIPRNERVLTSALRAFEKWEMLV